MVWLSVMANNKTPTHCYSKLAQTKASSLPQPHSTATSVCITHRENGLSNRYIQYRHIQQTVFCRACTARALRMALGQCGQRLTWIQLCFAHSGVPQWRIEHARPTWFQYRAADS